MVAVPRQQDLPDLCRQAAEALPTLFPEWQKPDFLIQFGPGFQPTRLFDEPPQAVPLSRLPGMPAEPTPAALHPELSLGLCRGRTVLALAGHRHLAEAYGTAPCFLPVAAAALQGCRRHILVGTAIGLRPDLKTGGWTLLTDFINWHHVSPLDGLAALLPDPFPDMTDALSQPLNSEIVNSLSEVGVTPRLITYLAHPGFHACTRAEADFIRMTGVDAVGHDLAMEIITAHALGCQVSALALLTGQLLPGMPTRFDRRDMLETCSFCSAQLLRGLRLAIAESEQ